MQRPVTEHDIGRHAIGRCQPAAQAGRKVELRFFPNLNWLPYYHAARDIRRWFPEAKTYPRMFYENYMANLRDCDLVLSTFPFGGTNSHIDAMLMGIPIVALDYGPEIHSRFDGMMLRRVGLGDLVADTVERYEEIAVDLIQNPQRRAVVPPDEIRQVFFGERTGPANGRCRCGYHRHWCSSRELAPGASHAH